MFAIWGVAALLLLMTACRMEEAEQGSAVLAPPNPKLSVKGKEVSYVEGSYSWSSNGRAVHADSPAPPVLVNNITPAAVAPDAEMLIEFAKNPISLDISIWGQSFTRGKPINQDLKGNVLSLPREPGRYIYNILARWPEGEGNYAFLVEVQHEPGGLLRQLEEANQKLAHYESIMSNQENVLLNGTLAYGSTSGMDKLLMSKMLLDHFRGVLWKKEAEVAPEHLPSDIRIWRKTYEGDYRQFGYIVAMEFLERFTVELMTDREKWLQRGWGPIESREPVTFSELVFYVAAGETVPHLYVRDGDGPYLHFVVDVETLRPPNATQRYDWESWVKALMEYNERRGAICPVECVDMSELRKG
jgi:hypothetical protein